VSDDGDLDTEQGSAYVLAEVRLVALVVGVRDEGDARGKEFGARRLDVDRLVRPCGLFEVGRGFKREPVICPWPVAVLKLCLGDGRTEGDVPQRGSLGLIGLAASKRAQKGLLGDRLRRGGDRLVRHTPIDRDAEVAPQGLELLLVLRGEPLTQFDKVASRDGELVGGLGGLAVAALIRRLKTINV